MLELKNVNFTRDNKHILKDINLVIPDDKFVVVTGPNGSGKSTLAKVIMGIENPDTGTILLDGEDITKMSIDERARRGIGFAFQQVVKFKGLTVYDLIRLSAGKAVNKAEACEILSAVGLCAKEYIDREVNSSLSGGELKRIEIATVAIRQNKLIIFDEPEAGIDLWSFSNLIDLFKDLREKNTNSTTLIISHQERIIDIADMIVLLKDGEVAEVADKDDLNTVYVDKQCCKLSGGRKNG
ncbi:MAG: ATP-binding cassette domain-containing protein [Clostridia bacterium]|nr:ATP-binding cassette domain-containing protein [Clostridia bacterium]